MNTFSPLVNSLDSSVRATSSRLDPLIFRRTLPLLLASNGISTVQSAQQNLRISFRLQRSQAP